MILDRNRPTRRKLLQVAGVLAGGALNTNQANAARLLTRGANATVLDLDVDLTKPNTQQVLGNGAAFTFQLRKTSEGSPEWIKDHFIGTDVTAASKALSDSGKTDGPNVKGSCFSSVQTLVYKNGTMTDGVPYYVVVARFGDGQEGGKFKFRPRKSGYPRTLSTTREPPPCARTSRR